MICPHCQYTHDGFYNEGSRGDFYRLRDDEGQDITLHRWDVPSCNKEFTTLYGCPQCKKTFID